MAVVARDETELSDLSANPQPLITDDHSSAPTSPAIVIPAYGEDAEAWKILAAASVLYFWFTGILFPRCEISLSC